MKNNLILTITAVILTSSVLHSSGQIIPVEFVTPGTETPLASGTFAGAADGYTSNFDNVDITSSGARASGGVILNDNTDTPSGVSFTLGGPQQGNGDLNTTAPSSGIQLQYNNFIQNPASGFNTDGSPSNATTLTLTNITYSTYNILVYVATNSGATAGVSLAGNTLNYYLTDSTGPGNNAFGAYAAFEPTSYVLATDTTGVGTTGANYVEFTGLTGASQTIEIGGEGNAAITSGFEIVNAAAAPEPSTWALLATGFGLSVICSRMRSRRLLS